ncbi:MAG: flagellar hook-length control protein FliK [Nitrospinota bacterium]
MEVASATFQETPFLSEGDPLLKSSAGEFQHILSAETNGSREEGKNNIQPLSAAKNGNANPLGELSPKRKNNIDPEEKDREDGALSGHGNAPAKESHGILLAAGILKKEVTGKDTGDTELPIPIPEEAGKQLQEGSPNKNQNVGVLPKDVNGRGFEEEKGFLKGGESETTGPLPSAFQNFPPVTPDSAPLKPTVSSSQAGGNSDSTAVVSRNLSGWSVPADNAPPSPHKEPREKIENNLRELTGETGADHIEKNATGSAVGSKNKSTPLEEVRVIPGGRHSSSVLKGTAGEVDASKQSAPVARKVEDSTATRLTTSPDSGTMKDATPAKGSEKPPGHFAENVEQASLRQTTSPKEIAPVEGTKVNLKKDALSSQKKTESQTSFLKNQNLPHALNENLTKQELALDGPTVSRGTPEKPGVKESFPAALKQEWIKTEKPDSQKLTPDVKGGEKAESNENVQIAKKSDPQTTVKNIPTDQKPIPAREISSEKRSLVEIENEGEAGELTVEEDTKPVSSEIKEDPRPKQEHNSQSGKPQPFNISETKGEKPLQKAENSAEGKLPDPTSAEKKKTVENLSRKMESFIKTGKNEFSIRLYPEALGTLQVKIRSQENHLRVNMVTESQLSKAVIESTLNELKTSLLEQGIEADTFSVTVGKESSLSHQGSTNRERETRFSTGKTRAAKEEAPQDSVKENGEKYFRSSNVNIFV